MLFGACGGVDDDPQVASEGDELSDGAQDDVAEGGGSEDLLDACTFLAPEEIGAVIGREPSEGEPQAMVEGMSECRFETATGMEASTTYDDPAIPETSLGSVTIAVNASDAEEFDLFEESLGAEAEAVSGLGDDAYFWANNQLFVRVADRGFSIRIEAEGTDEQALRDAMLELAEAGVTNLQ